MRTIDKIMKRFYHPVYIYTSRELSKATLKEQYIFVYSKTIHSISDRFYGHINLFKAGCRSYLEKTETASDIYRYRFSSNMTMLHVLIHNLFNRNKIVIINACIDFPEFWYSSNSYIVDDEEQMRNFPYKFKGQIFHCENTSKYFYYSDGKFIEKDNRK